MATGGCLCGTVRYEVGEAMMAAYCHCSRCRRITGSNAIAGMLMQTDQVKVTQGDDNIGIYKEAGFGNRAFCTTCGSTLFGYQWPDGAMTVVSLGTIDPDNEPPVAPSMHIHVASKADWDSITDALPQVAGDPQM